MLSWTPLDGAIMGFDRDSGLNVLYADERTATLRRQAPRSLQIGLLTPCNLSCEFCYRDTTAPSRLTVPFLVDLLVQAERWGVLEVAFGGGEPLIFKHLVELVDALHERTRLGVNLTTNGMLLTDTMMDRLRGRVGEIRLSAYDTNDWAATLRRLRGENIGINWLVTPNTVANVADRVRQFVDLGARNVLLLGYKGHQDELRLDPAGVDMLRTQLRHVADLPLRVDICLYPLLADLPHLFARTDCGAGDDILVITPDRAIQACSFTQRRIPFDTFDDLVSIYRMLKTLRPHADVGGCTRHLFTDRTDTPVASGRVLPLTPIPTAAPATPRAEPPPPAVWTWPAFASSNSGPYTILAQFAEPADAAALAGTLKGLIDAHIDHQRKSEHYGSGPTPPLDRFAQAHGFAWPRDDPFAWEEDDDPANAMQVAALGPMLIVHHSYAQDIGTRAIEHMCAVLGADRIVSTEQDFHLVLTPQTEPAAQRLAAAFTEEALSDLDDDEDFVLGADAVECPFRVELRTGTTTTLVGFYDDIGGQTLAARFVLALVEHGDVSIELHGGAPPRPLTGGPRRPGAAEVTG